MYLADRTWVSCCGQARQNLAHAGTRLTTAKMSSRSWLPPTAQLRAMRHPTRLHENTTWPTSRCTCILTIIHDNLHSRAAKTQQNHVAGGGATSLPVPNMAGRLRTQPSNDDGWHPTGELRDAATGASGSRRASAPEVTTGLCERSAFRKTGSGRAALSYGASAHARRRNLSVGYLASNSIKRAGEHSFGHVRMCVRPKPCSQPNVCFGSSCGGFVCSPASVVGQPRATRRANGGASGATGQAMPAASWCNAVNRSTPSADSVASCIGVAADRGLKHAGASRAGQRCSWRPRPWFSRIRKRLRAARRAAQGGGAAGGGRQVMHRRLD